MKKKKIIDILKNNDIRITDNRVAILHCLADEKQKHFHSVSEIIEHVGNVNSKSVYNNIKVLVSKGIVDAYSFGGVSKYAMNDHFKGDHDVIHMVDNNDNVSHLAVGSETFQAIKDKVVENGFESASVNIFVNIKN